MELPGIATPSELPTPVAIAAPPAPWSPAVRLAFRIAFIYFICFIVLGANGTLLDIFPVVGGWIQDKLNWPLNHLSEFVGQHLFHLTGIAAHWHPSESGDTAMNWIHDGLVLTIALAGGILWTILSHLRNNPRTDYRTLHAWLRFFLRLTCAMFMIGYGMVKVFPFQMPPPSVAVLTEPAGNMAPMTFLWNLIGLSPVYEMICGSAEVLGGVLLLYRRTALAGAIFSTFVVTNIVLYNYCYDVPVKLFATNLLLACIFLALPDAVSLVPLLLEPQTYRTHRLLDSAHQSARRPHRHPRHRDRLRRRLPGRPAHLRRPSAGTDFKSHFALHRLWSAPGISTPPTQPPAPSLTPLAAPSPTSTSLPPAVPIPAPPTASSGSPTFISTPKSTPPSSIAISLATQPNTPGSSPIRTTSFSPRCRPPHPNPTRKTSPSNLPHPSLPPSSP